MVKVIETDTELVVQHRSYVIGIVLLIMMIFSIVDQSQKLLSGELEIIESFGLLAVALISILGIYYFVEFGTFTFSRNSNHFSWHWNNLFVKKSGDLPFSKISKVRRDAMESSNLLGYQNTYRLIVMTDDDQQIPLSRSFSGIQDKQLDDVVDRIREYIKGDRARSL